MFARRLFPLAAARLAVAAFALTAACSDDDGTDPSSLLVGTWNVTSFSALGQDFILAGMTMTITLSSAGSYTINITNDQIDACDPGPNCTQTGQYDATDSQLTINTGTVDATTFTYEIDGDNLTLTGSIDEIPVVIELERD